MRIDPTGAGDGERLERAERAPAKAHAFRAALRTAKRRDDQDDAAAGQAAQLRAAPAEPRRVADHADAPPGATAATTDQPAVTSDHSAGASANQAIESAVETTADGLSHAATALPAAAGSAARAARAQVAANGADVMSAGSADSAASTALTASIAATLAFATGNAPAARPAGAQASTQATQSPAPAHDAIDPRLAATLGLGAPAVAPPTSAPPAPAAKEDSPVSALLAAAVSRAVGAFAARPGDPAQAAPPPDAAPAVTALPAGLDQLVNLTPLEQAVHALIGKLTDRADDDPRPAASDADLAPFHALASAHLAAHGAEPVPLEAASKAASAPGPAPLRDASPVDPNPSHLHLVVDDGPDRVVVTVAMRGNDVHVAMRSADDTTTTALARNAASLDHAMRARGLALGELTAEREPAERRPSQQPRDERDRKPAPKFTLEEPKP
jgi:hypothetical protein